MPTPAIRAEGRKPPDDPPRIRHANAVHLPPGAYAPRLRPPPLTRNNCAKSRNIRAHAQIVCATKFCSFHFFNFNPSVRTPIPNAAAVR